MADVRHLIVGGRYENIPTITDFVGEAAAAAGFTEDEIYHCQLAADEACTNIIEHAYGGEGKGEIKITCRIELGLCEILVIDEGKRFNPMTVPKPDLEADIDTIKPGGIGLHLMRQFMDEIHFEFGEDDNRLTLVKRSAERPRQGQAGEIVVREAGPGVWQLSPGGRLDSSTAPMLEAAFRDLQARGHYRLIVDMDKVTYISSRGLKALVSAWRRSRDAGGEVSLCSMSLHVRKVFDTVGFTRIFAIHDTCDAALAAAKAATDSAA